jgi:outer membrane lipoprotein LolB
MPRLHSTDPFWQQHHEKLENIQNWQLNARIAVVDANHAWSSGVIWQQQKQDFQIVFNSATGGLMRLSGNNKQVLLETAEQQNFIADNADELIAQVLDVQLPVQNLYYWIRGLPAKSKLELYSLNKDGSLQTLEQEGWQVQFLSYTDLGDILLPAKLYLQHPDYRIRIAINNWELTTKP